MRWPWQRRETRESGGDFSDAVVRLIEAQAAGGAGLKTTSSFFQHTLWPHPSEMVLAISLSLHSPSSLTRLAVARWRPSVSGG